MAQKDDLLELIRSLSKTEKRYFKLHADRYSNDSYKSRYEKLYDAFDNWPDETYDEAEFRRKNRGKAFITDLASGKKYLRSLVMKVLRNFNSDTDTEAQLWEMLMNIHILINKGLKDQAYRMIEKALELAEESDQLNEILVIHDYLLKLHNLSQGDAAYNAADIEQMDKKVMTRIHTTRQMIYLRSRMGEISNLSQWVQRGAEATQILADAEELAVAGAPLTRRAELSLLNVRQHYLMHHKEFRKCLDYVGEWLGKIEQSQSAYEYSPYQYKVTLANYISCAFRCEELELLPPAIAKLKAMKKPNEQFAADCFRITANAELVYILNTRNFEGADALLAYLEEGFKKYEPLILERRMVQHRSNISLLCFFRKKYPDALTHIAAVYQLAGRDESYLYIMILARTIEWMCQCSMGNTKILDPSLRNLKRYFADRQLKDDFYDVLFELFGHIVKTGKKPKSIESFRQRMAAAAPPRACEQLKDIVLAWL